MDASDEANQAIFRDLLQHDPDPVVRQHLLRLVNDLLLLHKATTQDDDATVREHAAQRLRRLLCGNEGDSPTVEDRLAFIETLEDSRLLEQVTRQAKEREIREALMLRLDRDALYGDIALQDIDPELRFMAVQCINHRTTLERVHKGARTKDKRVRLVAQEKLADIKTSEERPEALKQQAKKLCARMDSLQMALKSEPDSIRLRAQRQDIDKEWQAIQTAWADEALDEWDEKISERYTRACELMDQLLSGYAEQAARRAEEEKACEPIRIEKERIYGQLNALMSELDDFQGEVDDALHQRIQDTLIQADGQWQASGDLPGEEARKTNQAFKDLSGKLQRRAEDAKRYLQGVRVCNQLIEKLEKQQQGKRTTNDAKLLKSVEKQWAALEKPTHFKLPEALLNRTQAVIDALRERKEKAEQEREKALKAFSTTLNALEKALTEGKSKQASTKVRQLSNHLKFLTADDVKRLRDSGDYARYQRASGQLKELKDWHGWASNPHREALCEEAEALAQEVESCGVVQNYDFHAASKKIQDARKRWKSLGPLEGENCEAQWQRFNEACNRAYEPCQKFFNSEAEQREQNLSAKEAICAEVEAYYRDNVEGRSEDEIDWKQLDRTVSTALQSWRAIGAVRRKDHTAVRDRFNDALQKLKAVLKEERERNRAQKEELIVNADKIAASLAESDKSPQVLRDSASAIKLLQASWKEVGYAAEEKKLWKRFRAACDSVFNERQAQFDFMAEERRSNLTQKETLCELIERMSELQGEDVIAAQGRVDEIKTEWHLLGEVPHDERDEVERRFRQACKAFNTAINQQDRYQQEAERQVFYDKHELCVQLELLMDELIDKQLAPEEVATRLETIQQTWQEKALTDSDINKALLHRFEHDIDMLHQLLDEKADVQEITTMLREMQALSLQKKQAWCLAMEILAGIDSPSELEEQRMALQVQMLAQKHSHDQDEHHLVNSVTDIEDQWYSTCSPAALEAVRLERRFSLARQALLTSAPDDKPSRSASA